MLKVITVFERDSNQNFQIIVDLRLLSLNFQINCQFKKDPEISKKGIKVETFCNNIKEKSLFDGWQSYFFGRRHHHQKHESFSLTKNLSNIFKFFFGCQQHLAKKGYVWIVDHEGEDGLTFVYWKEWMEEGGEGETWRWYHALRASFLFTLRSEEK